MVQCSSNVVSTGSPVRLLTPYDSRRKDKKEQQPHACVDELMKMGAEAGFVSEKNMKWTTI